MPAWEIFYFLWDDPLFTNLAGDPKDYIDEPDFIELRRTMRLELLDWLYAKVEILQYQLTQEKHFHREAQAREVWTINQFLKVVPHGEAEPILINRKVNGMDPDFSFEAALAE